MAEACAPRGSGAAVGMPVFQDNRSTTAFQAQIGRVQTQSAKARSRAELPLEVVDFAA